MPMSMAMAMAMAMEMAMAMAMAMCACARRTTWGRRAGRGCAARGPTCRKEASPPPPDSGTPPPSAASKRTSSALNRGCIQRVSEEEFTATGGGFTATGGGFTATGGGFIATKEEIYPAHTIGVWVVRRSYPSLVARALGPAAMVSARAPRGASRFAVRKIGALVTLPPDAAGKGLLVSLCRTSCP
eukprot:938850-Prorocentrum_minimum.AAC.1